MCRTTREDFVLSENTAADIPKFAVFNENASEHEADDTVTLDGEVLTCLAHFSSRAALHTGVF